MMEQPRDEPPVVLLLHGLGRTWTSMVMLGLRLRCFGFRVLNIGYGARRQTIAASADEVATRLRSRLKPGTPVIVIGHSLGGIIARTLVLRQDPHFRITAVVMLGSPNRGSALAGTVAGWCSRVHPRLVDWIFGPVLQELAGLTLSAWPTAVRLCIVAGGTGGTRGYLPLVSGDNDGIVAVSETVLEGASIHRVVPHVHTFLMYQSDVFRIILDFIKQDSAADGGGLES